MSSEEIPLENDNLITYREFLKKRVEHVGLLKYLGLYLRKELINLLI
jgi:hypothetical protein